MHYRSIGDIETAFRATLVSSTNTSTCSANTNNSSSHTSTSPSEEKEEEEMEKGKEEGGKGEKKEDTQLLADKRDIDGATRSRFRNIGVLCEYDALPEIGHACGHNLIAEAGNMYMHMYVYVHACMHAHVGTKLDKRAKCIDHSSCSHASYER